MSNNANRLVGKRIADRYCITGEIGKGGMGVVYRAIPIDDPSHSVAIKVIQRTGKLGYDDLMRFQKEASLMSQLHHPNIVVFHELGLLGHDFEEEDGLGSGYYIVMEIADGTNLKESLSRDGRKDLAYFFQVGLQVSTALDYTHGKNIIHRDIKPHNIIVGQAWRDQRGVLVKVLDFGIARLAEAIHSGGRDPITGKSMDEAAGTPLYMAPEQTPLMDAPVDHRVDLYSLGCVLYELLAGKPPFSASSREKLEKQHVFAEPEPLTHLRPDIPPLIEKIVHKLLAKHPNDRYLTAFALHADLMRAKNMFEKSGRPSGISFPLGLKDRFQAVSAQLQLVGRDTELATLIDEYDGVAKDRGRSRLTLIRGVAGIGKSRLMAEFQTYLARRKVRFVSGQFSQHENALPFNALANAFNEYLHRVLKSYPHEAEELRRRLRTTLGPVAHHIAEIVPGLKPYLLDLPDEITEADAANVAGDITTSADDFATFAKAFSDFTKCLDTDNQPIVFLFHDLHWADAKSLDLIDTFFSNANSLRFYLVVSQRSGVHLINNRFNTFIEKFSKLKRRYTEIELQRVSRDAIRGIVGNMLSSVSSVTEELVAYLDHESKGNPMHLVELTRTLVARDLIYPKATIGDWEFDIKALQKTQVQLNTIDLILSRIQEYGEFDRQVLGVAATIGLTFQFEILLLGGRSQSVPVMKTIQRAVDEGLVVRVTDDPDLRHLGKTFMFAHKKARDAIYESMDLDQRRALHKAIGEKLEASIAQPSEKIIFALAHHFNSALGGGQTEDQKLAERCLRYNTKAGYAANRSESWQTAERYFENAWRIMEQWQDKICTREERALVQETLADLAAVQKRHGRALKVYRELLDQRLQPESHANIAYKAIYFQIVGGIISETGKMIDATLRSLRRPVPKVGWLTRLRLAWSIFVDCLPIKYRKKRLYDAMRQAHALRGESKDAVDRRFPAIRLYLAGTQLHLQENVALAMAFHDLALQEALRGRGSPASVMRVVADRAAILGYLGFTKVGYRFLDLAMDTARANNLRSIYGYIALLRVLTIDYVKGRHEEISGHLGEALNYLGPNEERLAHGQSLLFKMFRELIRCNFPSLYRTSQRMPDTIPTRNWLSPRAVSMMLFGYLLQGARDSIVRHGEMFLKRRQKVASRGNDLFIKIIHTLIAFARGETDKTRESYILAMNDFVVGSRRSYLWPFEEDFVAIFAFTLPVLFEQEYGRHLMRVQEMAGLLVRLRLRALQLKGQNRAIPMLLRARADELLGKPKMVRSLYDQALKSSKIGTNNLVQILAYLWFGNHLLDQGQTQKGDYIRRAYALASKLDMKALVELTRKVMEKRQIKFKEYGETAQHDSQLSVSELGPGGDKGDPRLSFDHLVHLSEAAEADTPLVDDLSGSIRILSRHYRASRIVVVVATDQASPRVLYPPPGALDLKDVATYVEPYLNIRSTLFLPHNDAPWFKGERPVELSSSVGPDAGQPQALDPTGDSASDVYGSQASAKDLANTDDGSFDGSSTMVLEGESSPAEATKPHRDASGHREGRAAPAKTAGDMQASSTMAVNSTRRSDSAPAVIKKKTALQMSALVPLRSHDASLGLVYVEDIANIMGRDTSYSRQELDQYGAQLALLLERKSGGMTASVSVTARLAQGGGVNAVYQPASYTIESAPWLRVWQKGRLRARRETSWFLGLNFGPNHYVLAYCMLTGNDGTREKLGSMLWHHLYVMRALAIASGRNQVELSELREDLTSFFVAMPETAELEAIAMAFSVINRQDQVAFSGHFGPSRPFTIGVENVVTPYNDVVLTFANGRDLRYWDVAADLKTPHALIISYDTSKLDNATVDTVQKRVAPSLAEAKSADELHAVLTTVIPENHLPRYYVSLSLNQTDADTLPAAG